MDEAADAVQRRTNALEKQAREQAELAGIEVQQRVQEQLQRLRMDQSDLMSILQRGQALYGKAAQLGLV